MPRHQLLPPPAAPEPQERRRMPAPAPAPARADPDYDPLRIPQRPRYPNTGGDFGGDLMPGARRHMCRRRSCHCRLLLSLTPNACVRCAPPCRHWPAGPRRHARRHAHGPRPPHVHWRGPSPRHARFRRAARRRPAWGSVRPVLRPWPAATDARVPGCWPRHRGRARARQGQGTGTRQGPWPRVGHGS